MASSREGLLLPGGVMPPEMALLILLPPCIFSSFILAPETPETPESLSSPGSVTFWREAGGGLHLLPPGDTWVKPGQGNVTLMCLANRRVEQCSWTTPYGKVDNRTKQAYRKK